MRIRKLNTAIFLPNSFFYSLDCKFVSLYIAGTVVLSGHQCKQININNSALNTLSKTYDTFCDSNLGIVPSLVSW